MLTKRAGQGLLVLSFILAMVPLTGCETSGGTGQEGETQVDINPGEPPQFAPENTVCNPWGDSGMAADRGIVARLNYMKPGVCRLADVDDPNTPQNETAPLSNRPRTALSYVDELLGFSIATDVTLFFNKLFIGTRYFDRGFATQDGQVITNAAGNTLYEWFGVEFQTQLKLFDSDANLLEISPGLTPQDYPAGYFEGDYQLAVLSDDGAMVYLESSDGSIDLNNPLIDNDGEHATKLGCAQRPVRLMRGEKIPIRIHYYQGPRHHISLVLMWRKWPANNNWAYSQTDQTNGANRNLCGPGVNFSSNSFYFTPGNVNEPAATPTANFQEMLANGWQVLETQNYSLPGPIVSNPCTPPEPLLTVNGVVVANVTTSTATLTWTTSAAAVSHVEYRLASCNPATTSGCWASGTPTTMFTTNHQVTVSGLTANTLYVVKASSTSPGGQTAVSEEVAFRTRR